VSYGFVARAWERIGAPVSIGSGMEVYDWLDVLEIRGAPDFGAIGDRLV
jgi:hypothetical protein